MARNTKSVSISLPLEVHERLSVSGGVSAAVTADLEMMVAIRDHGLRRARRVLGEVDLGHVRQAMQGVFFDASQIPVWLSGNGLAHQIEDALGPGGDLEGLDDSEALMERVRELDTLAQLAVILWAVGDGR